jgi:hypothetical protein
MKILPLRTLPFSSKVDRRHTPKLATGRFGYREYRACLRWEFGFSCAFCLMHEADLAEFGTERLGVTGVEHFVPVSARGKINHYENCFYACCLCNRARSSLSQIDPQGFRLLHPCGHTWASHFEASQDDRLLPVQGDGDAQYTHRTYDLDDPRKVEARRVRRERISESLRILMEGPEILESLVRRLDAEPLGRGFDLERAINHLRQSIEGAEKSLRRYVAVPVDADRICRCGRNDHHRLPAGLADQLLAVHITD